MTNFNYHEKNISTDHFYIKISSEIIDTNDAFQFVSDNKNGATVSFIGTVRNFNKNKEVLGINYDCYTSLAINIIKKACVEMANKYNCSNLKISIINRVKFISVGQCSIIIAVSSRHRDEAFNVCTYILNTIKYYTPIWKEEKYTNKTKKWVTGSPLINAKNAKT